MRNRDFGKVDLEDHEIEDREEQYEKDQEEIEHCMDIQKEWWEEFI